MDTAKIKDWHAHVYFDAITTERPYKMAASPGHAYEELTNEAKKGWRRKDLVEAFIALQEAGATV